MHLDELKTICAIMDECSKKICTMTMDSFCDDAALVRQWLAELENASRRVGNLIRGRELAMIKPQGCVVAGQRVRIKCLNSGRYTGQCGTVVKADEEFVKIHLDRYDGRLDDTGNCLIFDDEDVPDGDSDELMSVDMYVGSLVDSMRNCSHFFTHHNGPTTRFCTTCETEVSAEIRSQRSKQADLVVDSIMAATKDSPRPVMRTVLWSIVDEIHTDWLIKEPDTVIIQVMIELRKLGHVG